MTPDLKIIFGIIALAIGLIGYLPYFHTIFKGRTRPHVFSWFIWGVLTAIAFAIQLSEQAGPGAWITGITALICFSITVVALHKGERSITKSDWATFIAALASIPLWLATQDPLYSVILISLIDALGYYPTFRKTWHKPHEEALITHALSGFKWVFAIAALDKITMTTAFYPFSLIVMSCVFVGMTLWRRYSLMQKNRKPL